MRVSGWDEGSLPARHVSASAIISYSISVELESGTRSIIGFVVAVVLALLSALHVYWAVGGQAGLSLSIPTVDGERVFEPGRAATLAVAAALALAVLVIAGTLGYFGSAVPPFAYRWLSFAVGLVFLLRALGDFRLVGFFKAPSSSAFAYWDSRLFSPLCALIAVGSFVVALG